MASRSAEEWFELGMACDSNSESLDQAAEAYEKPWKPLPDGSRRASIWAPRITSWAGWKKHCEQFKRAIELEPKNALAEFNLGCVHQQLGDLSAAIQHLALIPSNSCLPWRTRT